MSDYVKATNFYAKDALLTGNPDKLIKGAEIDAEYNAIATAVATKANLNSPNFTGTPTVPTATPGTSTTQVASTAFVQALANTLGDMSTQDADDVTITGGTITATFTGNITGNVTGNASGNAGTVTNGVYTTNFSGSNQSLSSSGYQKIPGGLIFQWGETSSINSDSSLSVTFPIAFTTACFQVFSTGTATTSGTGEVTLNTRDLTTTTFTMINDGGKASTARWFAIGR